MDQWMEKKLHYFLTDHDPIQAYTHKQPTQNNVFTRHGNKLTSKRNQQHFCVLCIEIAITVAITTRKKNPSNQLCVVVL